jgi:hypothetical protein
MVMGWFNDAVKVVTSSVSQVAEVATGGKLGKMISDALERFGLPKEICGIIACIGDPSYTTKFLCEEIDRIGKALGLPEELTGALKKVVQNAEKYAKALATGGFGAVVAEVGKDLGLPPELYLAVAAAVDAYTGNPAGAGKNLTLLAGQCARRLGVPDSAMNIVEFTGAAYAGNLEGMKTAGLDLGMDMVDGLDAVPPELKTMMHVTVAGVRGDEKAAQEGALLFAAQVGERMGLPPEVMGTLEIAVAHARDDDKARAHLEKSIGMMSPETRRAYELTFHLATGDIEALKADIEKLTSNEIEKLPPAAKEALTIAGKIADGDTETFNKELGKVQGQAIQELADKYRLPMRA